MTVSSWQHADLGALLSCDIAIIGGGIVGTSTAYWLKQCDPSLNIVLLESRSIGHGASGRNAGFLLQGTASNYINDQKQYGAEKAKALWAFTLENRALIEEQFSANKVHLKPTGSIIASGTPEEQDELQASAEALSRDGVDVIVWSKERLEQTLATQGFYGALFVPSGASMNPLTLVREIGGKSGARILEHHPVFEVKYHNGHCELSTPLRTIRAQRVFFALNAYLPLLLPATATYIRPVRAQMFGSTRQPHWLDLPIYSHHGYYYIRQSPDGQILLGGARHLYKEEEVGYEDQTTPHLQSALESYYHTHFPGRPSLAVAQRWSGTMAFTSDGLPLFSEVDDFPGSYWAAGFNGHGMGYGFRFGKLMANVITESEPEPYYRNLFHISRQSPII